MKKKYSLPWGYGNLREHTIWYDEDEEKNYNKVKARVRSLSLREVEDVLIDLIMGQIMETMIVDTKVS